MGAYFGIAEFTHQTQLYLAAQLLGHGLHAVTNTQYRHAEFEHGLRSTRRPGFGNRMMTPREDDALGREIANKRVIDVVRMNFRIDMRFAHAPGDQLGDLGAEIENQDFVVHRGGKLERVGDLERLAG